MLCCCNAAPTASLRPPTKAQSMISKDMIGVTVPPNMGPGQTLLVKHPNAIQTISVIIPHGFSAGSVFHVRFPSAPSRVVTGVSRNHATAGNQQDGSLNTSGKGPNSHSQIKSSTSEKTKYKRCSDEMLLLHRKGLVKVAVPPNLSAGDRMQVQIPDGRKITVTIPPGNISEFHVKVPTKPQNFHDNPIAVHAPMFFGPML